MQGQAFSICCASFPCSRGSITSAVYRHPGRQQCHKPNGHCSIESFTIQGGSCNFFYISPGQDGGPHPVGAMGRTRADEGSRPLYGAGYGGRGQAPPLRRHTTLRRGELRSPAHIAPRQRRAITDRPYGQRRRSRRGRSLRLRLRPDRPASSVSIIVPCNKETINVEKERIATGALC